MSEGHGVTLGKSEVGEGGERRIHLFGHRLGHAPGSHAGEQAVAEPGHALARPLGAHGLTQFVGLGRAEPGHIDGDLHQLLLEERHAEGAFQGRLHQRMEVGDGLGPVAPPDVGVHGVALDGAGPDEGDLDSQVVEAAGLHPGQGVHLGSRLDLEHAHRVGPAQEVVDLVLLVEEGQIDGDPVGLGHQVDHVVQGGEHAEAEEVELDQAGRRAVVLVPLQHAASGHPSPLHRAHFHYRPVADDHAARVDAEMARKPEQLRRQLLNQRRQILALGQRLAALGRPGPAVGLLGGVAEGLAYVAQGRAGPVGDDVGHLGGVEPAVAGVDVLDDLFAPARLDVDVDVGRPVASRGQEALEEQAERHRVHVGDAEGEADGRGGGRSSALAEDVLALAELDDVPHGEEVAREPEGPDHLELVVDLSVGPRHPFESLGPIPLDRPPPGQLGQPGLLGVSFGHGEIGEPRCHQPEIERALGGQLAGPVHGPGPPGEPPPLLGFTPQAGGG